MDLDAITVFVKVVEAHSFSGAARLLKMPKTTVSAKIAALEKRLGVSLLHRTTRQLHLTEAGRHYYVHCAKAVQELELGESALLAARGRPAGPLRITAPIDIGHTLLPKIARAYLEKNPGTSIEMILSNRVSDLVAEGIDLAIRVGKLADSSLVGRRFFDLSMRLWTSASYRDATGILEHPEQLMKHRFVAYTGMAPVMLTDGSTDVEVAPRPRVTADDFEAIRSMLVLGEGIGLLPDFLAMDPAYAGALVPVLPRWKFRTDSAFSFIYHSRKYTSPNVQAFIHTAMELLSDIDVSPAENALRRNASTAV
ncbi:LysR family transcriptional regulator [Massilia sp. IC2-477]|uniref:LysR family transcriptional regulator n=1 Tax=Massilia sp. IC2-477 TaxID=2887198 RepID=UPI001D10E2E4|nr:LysR family transcriptional regulator [Massilia sp. IC2-477]MCC2954343.1 LysR family transcriptional regulator [Massilia sp. IC2-477]